MPEQGSRLDAANFFLIQSRQKQDLHLLSAVQQPRDQGLLSPPLKRRESIHDKLIYVQSGKLVALYSLHLAPGKPLALPSNSILFLFQSEAD